MTERSKELKTTLGEIVEDRRRDLGPHPSPEELVAYKAGELSAAEVSRLQEHLVLCPDCLELLLDSECFRDAAFGSRRAVSETEVAAAWKGMRRGTDRKAPVATVLRGRFRRFPGPSSPRLPYALAATLLIAVLALSLWVASLRQTLGELSRPRLNTPLHDVYPESFVRGDDAAAPGVRIPADAELFTLILNSTMPPSYAETLVEIVEPDGTEVWSGAGLETSPAGSFTLTLPRRFLDAGEYRIRLYGLDGGRRELIEEYPLRLEYP
ncbi:MAG: hypothetical protein GY856_13120 [bacterium]|nr:hypothetical protein [bacterium]